MFQVVAHLLQRLGLVARFSIIGAIVGAILVGGLAWFIEARLTELMLAQVAARAIDQVELGVSNQVTAADFKPPFTTEKLNGLAARLRPLRSRARQEQSGVIRLHLFAGDGTVIYSDLMSKRGQAVPPTSLPALQQALAGSVTSKLSSLSSPENADLKTRYGSALEVYVPFALDGQVLGAYEIYQDLSPIRPIRSLVWGAVASGFVLLLLSLLTVVLRAAALIRFQQAERQRLLQQAAEAEALRELDRLKDEVVSVVSHELRTPLSTIVGFTELLLIRNFSESQRQQFLTIMQAEGQRLTDLINEFLDLQRIESGRQPISVTSADLRPILDGAVAAIGNDARHPLVVDLPEQLPLIQADVSRLRQVLDNLLANARKYSPDGGEVQLSVRRLNGTVEVAVSDQGLGIPPEAMPRLFEKFYRVGTDDRRAIPGTGLGLAICRKIVEAHGGRIWAESAGPGQGARFCFTVPVATGAASDARTQRVAQEAQAV